MIRGYTWVELVSIKLQPIITKKTLYKKWI